jgi:hypothetical protein
MLHSLCSFLSLTNAVMKHISNDVIRCSNEHALKVCTDTRLKEESAVDNQMNLGNALNMNVSSDVMC